MCLVVYALCLLVFAVAKERCTTGENVLNISSKISQNVERSVNISFFHQREKDYFCAWPQGLEVSFETNSQLWTNYCHRWPVCCCQSKMTHDVLANLHISSCSCLYRTILSSFTHPYAIPDPFPFCETQKEMFNPLAFL